MRRWRWITVLNGCLLAMLLIGVAASWAQAQMCGVGPTGSQTGSPAMMGRGMMGQGMGMMGMMPMMGKPMDPMGLMDDGQMDPKARGRMLQLRGELLKAMGEVLVKHGQALEQAQ